MSRIFQYSDLISFFQNNGKAINLSSAEQAKQDYGTCIKHHQQPKQYLCIKSVDSRDKYAINKITTQVTKENVNIEFLGILTTAGKVVPICYNLYQYNLDDCTALFGRVIEQGSDL